VKKRRKPARHKLLKKNIILYLNSIMSIFQEKVLWINSSGTPESGYTDAANFGIFSE
jgi:hypothetical protein